jgi:glycosyltransferase involved in cell wall biosynthesis
MKAEQPLVSVLMTAYNREAYIAEAIESVLASIYDHFELIIVDDGSKDSTVVIARDYAAKDNRVRVFVNEKNLGDYHNRNKAASYARGKYLKYWDSDDVLYPHALSVMVAAMEKFPMAGFGLVKAHMPIFNQPYPVFVEHPFRLLCQENSLFNNSPGSAIMKRELFESIGGFSGKRYIGDNEFWIKCSMHSPMVIIAGYLGWDRTHANQERNFDPVKYEDLRQSLYFEALENPANGLGPAEARAFKQRRKASLVKNALADLRHLRWQTFFKKRLLIKYLFK